ncbi:hypothetical protein [Pedosphaera parvula]|uniref:Roadblock/LAMTOR2 domain-containing protein n=1 Tax=Pedosphaera parvula (strain Ellin514) TaxID=320771 RepID=B9XCI0_PEDPL|nr:hypothetical protein [Pedosphaera parvula]EEF62648.1 hypothetical protein Cflav_PD5283 [Pedosphaera parvula Ellin514]
MGLLNLFAKPAAKLTPLPSGSFTVDREGRLLISTLGQAFPEELVSEIASVVLSTFQNAQAARLPLSQIILRYNSLKITARELRGGAIVFLAPQVLSSKRN